MSSNWHINSNKPTFSSYMVPWEVEHVILLQADGDELDFIRNRFDNIPISKGNICCWRGSMADFIYRNLLD